MGVRKEEWVRKAAGLAGEKYYMPLRPCVRGHLSKRLTSYGQCLECARILQAVYCQEHPDRVSESCRRSKLRHPDRVKRNWKDWYTKNRAHVAAYQREHAKEAAERAAKWRAGNPERANEIATYYKKAHRGVLASRTKARQCLKNQAMPAWVNAFEILAIYLLAERLSQETGIKHHVDHIVPLQGKTVTGLHVPWNLRAIPAIENLRKHNRLLDMAGG